MTEIFGLPKKCVEDIRNVFASMPSVERVLIFGSRAMGNYKPGSDVDLALFGETISYDDLLSLKVRLGEIPWAYMYDVVIYDKITNPAVQAHIDDFGLNFYEKEERMIENWSVMRLGDNCLKIGSGATPKGGQENYKTEGISLIRSQNVLDFTFSRDGLAFIDDKQAKELSNVEVSENDVLLNITGDSVARVCQVPKDVLPARVNQHVAIIRPKPEVLAADFLKYYLLNPKTKEFLLGLSSSGATRNALTKAMIENLEIFAPEDVSTQHRIAAILTALDDKIELNRRMNETLEGIAQAVWGEWFGKYANGEEDLPEGWRWGTVGEICSVNKFSLSKNDSIKWIDYIEISEVNRGKIGNVARYERGTEPSRARRKIMHGDIVLSTVRPDRGAYFLAQFPEETTIVSTGFAVFTAEKVPFGFLYIFLTTDEMFDFYGQMADGGAYPAINPSVILEKEIIIPDSKKLDDFQKVIAPIFEKIHQNNIQSRTLTALRDALLPRLMRGELII